MRHAFCALYQSAGGTTFMKCINPFPFSFRHMPIGSNEASCRNVVRSMTCCGGEESLPYRSRARHFGTHMKPFSAPRRSCIARSETMIPGSFFSIGMTIRAIRKFSSGVQHHGILYESVYETCDIQRALSVESYNISKCSGTWHWRMPKTMTILVGEYFVIEV